MGKGRLGAPQPLLVLAAFLLLAAISVFGVMLKPAADARTSTVLVVNVDPDTTTTTTTTDSDLDVLDGLSRTQAG